MLEARTGKKVGEEIGYAYNPEFIALGSVIRDFMNPDLVLIGESDPKTGDLLEGIYQRNCENSPYFGRTSVINAEITKLAINCYCTMKISFANQLAQLCDSAPGADASAVTQIMGRDSRIGTKYIRPGLGFGGPCFPRDNQAFIRFAETLGGGAEIQQAVVDINHRQIGRIASKITQAAEQFGNKVALLGLAYKPNTYLIEESQAVDVAYHLAEHHGKLDLWAYDPMARANGRWNSASSLEDCVRGAHVAAILTPWPEFFDTAWHGLMADNHSILNFWK